jgi:hypothetical protein
MSFSVAANHAAKWPLPIRPQLQGRLLARKAKAFQKEQL